MATNFQSSFIPKEPATQDIFKKQKSGIASSFALILFVLSILGAGGSYFYKAMLKGEIEDLKVQLIEAEGNIDRQSISELVDFNKKLKASDMLVSKHTVVSNFLEILSSSTVSSVMFDSFNYQFGQGNVLSVSLSGEASSYAAVALQESIFMNEKQLESITFSDLRLTEDGLVGFDVDIVVDPQVSVYAPPMPEIPPPFEVTTEAGVETETGTTTPLQETQTQQP